MFSSKVKYSSLILLLAVVVMFYSTALPFSAAVEPTIQYVPITLSIEDIAYFANQVPELSYFTGTMNSVDFVLYMQQMFITQENQTLVMDKQNLFDYSSLSKDENTVYFYLSDLNTAFTIDRGDSVFFEMSIYIPFEYYIGPDTVFQFGTYFQSPISNFLPGGSVFSDVYLMYGRSGLTGSFVRGSWVYNYLSLPITLDPIASSVLSDVVPPIIYQDNDVCKYYLTYTPTDVNDDNYLGGTVTGTDEVFLTFSVSFNLASFELDSDVFFPCFFIKPFTVYVREEIAPTVEEYLTAIANPSPESAAEVERLEQELEEISEQLREDASDLEVEKPDVSDSVEDLPSEVVDGMDEVGQTVLSPLMNLELIATLFSVLFGVVALKLILFGSGTS